ncbi:hypothetical protein D3C80_1544510 [compost metagenome]
MYSMLVAKPSALLILRVRILKKANISAASKGISEARLNTPSPGCRITKVPAKPITAASHCRLLTCSRSRTPARARVSSGKMA